MQIFVLNDRNHWIVFAKGTGRDEVQICDSLNSYGQGCSKERSKVICQKALFSSATLRIKNVHEQHQAINVDCGVFSIAFATDCVFDKKTETATYKTNVVRTYLKESKLTTKPL